MSSYHHISMFMRYLALMRHGKQYMHVVVEVLASLTRLRKCPIILLDSKFYSWILELFFFPKTEFFSTSMYTNVRV